MNLRNLIGALVFLESRSRLNALKARLRRLKQPKYLAGAIVGLGWLYLWFGRLVLSGFRARSAQPSGLADLGTNLTPLIEGGAALLLLVIVAAQWVLTGPRASLDFSEAELAFLLPAPLSRKALIRYKLLHGQLGALASALFLTLLSSSFTLDGRVLFHLVGWWLVLTLIRLHGLGASFAIQRLSERGMASWMRRLFALGIFAGLVLTVVVWWRMAPSLPAFANDPRVIAGDLKDWAELVLTSGPGPWLLAPFRLAIHPWFAANLGEFLLALVPAIALLVLHYFWVERSDVAFEEASLAFSEKRALILSAAREGKLPAAFAGKKMAPSPFVLAPLGWPAFALMWKNLIAARVTRRKVVWTTVIVLSVAIVIRVAPLPEPLTGIAWGIVNIAFGASALFGGVRLNAALRQDLGILDVLKGYPLPGWQIVLGELLAPAFTVSLNQVRLVAAAVVLALPIGADPLPAPFALVASGAVCAILVVLPLNFVNAIVPTAATLLFPAWAKPGKDGQHPGFEAVGQRIIFGVALLAALVVALTPAAGIGAGVFFVTQWVGGMELALVAAGLFAGTALAIEAAAGVRLLGRLYDGYDASAEQ